MRSDVLTHLLDQAEVENNKGGFLRAEELCLEVLHSTIRDSAEDDNTTLVLRARALSLQSESLARRRRATEALPIAKEALGRVVELGDKKEEAKVCTTLGIIYETLNDYNNALEFCRQALRMFQKQGDVMSEARAWIIHGTVNTSLGTYDLALDDCSRALAMYEACGSKQGVASATANLGIIYALLSHNHRALEYYSSALVVHEELGNRAGMASIMSNIGNVHVAAYDYKQALEMYKQALKIFEELDGQGFIAVVLNNIAWIYNHFSQYELALETYKRVLAIREANGDRLGAADQFANIGELYGNPQYEGYDAVKAEEYLLKGLHTIIDIGAKHSLSGTYKMVAEFYKAHQRWEEFAYHFEKFHDLEKEVLNEEATKAAALIEQRRQANEQEKKLVAERARAQATEELLHKTLPKSIAERVMQGERRIADHFDSVSILFADVVGFTELSARLAPAIVLDFMNHLFEHFDALAAKHGCERIKTIGDGYMAVCGAPVTVDNHAERLALMALDMMEEIILPQEIRKQLPKGTHFHLRIGLHCGEITAGLIGTGKLAYDIYGDAVNVASRMESSGEAARIHCSEEFALHLQRTVGGTGTATAFRLQERGEIEVKGKGRRLTYFLESVK